MARQRVALAAPPNNTLHPTSLPPEQPVVVCWAAKPRVNVGVRPQSHKPSQHP